MDKWETERPEPIEIEESMSPEARTDAEEYNEALRIAQEFEKDLPPEYQLFDLVPEEHFTTAAIEVSSEFNTQAHSRASIGDIIEEIAPTETALAANDKTLEADITPLGTQP